MQGLGALLAITISLPRETPESGSTFKILPTLRLTRKASTVEAPHYKRNQTFLGVGKRKNVAAEIMQSFNLSVAVRI